MSKTRDDVPLNDQLQELDKLVAWFDQDDFDVDAALVKFEQGVKLADDITKRLDTLENKITVLKKRFDAPSDAAA